MFLSNLYNLQKKKLRECFIQKNILFFTFFFCRWASLQKRTLAMRILRVYNKPRENRKRALLKTEKNNYWSAA